MSAVRWLLEPESVWERAAQRLAADPRGLLARTLFIALLGAFAAAGAVELGARFVTTSWNFEFGFRTTPAGPLRPFLPTFVGVLAGPLVLAGALLLMGRMYRLPFRPLAALAVAVQGTMPIYVALLTMWMPAAILLVCIAFIVSLFWWGLGNRRLLGIPAADSQEFLVLALLITTVATQFLGALLSFLLLPPR